jgi:hypothetical protein
MEKRFRHLLRLWHPFLQFAELQAQVSGLILQSPPFQRQAGQLVLQLTFLQFVCPKWSISQFDMVPVQ